MKFYICEHCKNIIGYLNNSGVKVHCCGDPMEELIPKTDEGATEKHVPVVTIDGNKVTVKVGEVPHPMEEKHYIQWVALETKHGHQRKELKPGCDPVVEFMLCPDDEFVHAYAYCNIHSLYIDK